MSETEIAPWLTKSKWPTVPIRLVARLGSGHTPSRSRPEYWDNCTIPWITLADVWQLRNGTASIIDETKEKVSRLGIANSAAVLHSAGTVILSRTASVGFSAIMGSDMATSQDFVTWSCGPRLDPRFLLHALRGMGPDLKRIAVGSTHKTIYMPDIEQLRVPLPPLGEQRRIAKFLDAETTCIDQLVEARRRHVHLVEERWESTIYQELTRDGADPVELRRLGVAVTTGPFGTIFSASEYEEGGIPMINPLHIKDGGIVPDRYHSVSSATAARLSRHRLRVGDLVVGRKGDLGRSALVRQHQDGWVCGSDSIALHPSEQLRPRFLAYVLRSQFVRTQLLARSLAATMPSLNEGSLLSLRVPKLDVRDQDRVVERLDTAHEWSSRVIAAMRSQLSLLAERRQALITAAVTGQFDLPTASGRHVTDGV
ncbi:restriction endonuclease subunit S [Streptomyces sp. NBC_00190]|uniref:restriction endonuclease subunit S n=1 Tax=Streptomyces sp. NBC_00190 TaxID=2903634 RepID=UPI002E297D1D|nr:restriction endonuclease subunit S [Streptomyces sp. NBC_00190]